MDKFGKIALDTYAPLGELRKRQKWKDRITEISINGPGKVFVRVAGEGYVQLLPKEAGFATRSWIEQLCRGFAASLEIVWSDQLPILACRTPDGDRFQAVVGRNVDEGGFMLSIRVKRIANVKFEDFGVRDPAAQDLLRRDVVEGTNMLISGGTGSGKTTFLNLLATFSPMWKRVVTAEDTRELVIPNPNRVHFIVSRTESATRIGWPEIIDSTLRANPDEFTLGELSISNAFYYTQILDTGHDSCRASMHANNGRESIRGVRRRVAMGGGAAASSETRDMLEFLADNIGRVVQIKHFPQSGKQTERREVVEIVTPKDLFDSRTDRKSFIEDERDFDLAFDMPKARGLLEAARAGEGLTAEDEEFLRRMALMVTGGAVKKLVRPVEPEPSVTFNEEERTLIEARRLGLIQVSEETHGGALANVHGDFAAQFGGEGTHQLGKSGHGEREGGDR